MKKTITTLLILVLAISSLFAADVNILSKAPESNLTAELQYNGITLGNNQNLQINATENLDNPIYQSTAPFSILVNSNKVTDTTLTVDIAATQFISEKGVNSDITPTVDKDFESSIQVLAGVHTNETVSTFTLNWTGKTGLSAGQYSSDVTITICAN